MPFILVLSLALFLARNAQATGTANDPIPSYSGILIRSGGAFEKIPAPADYVVNNFYATKPLSGTYRIGFRLVVGAGNSVSPEVFTASFSVSLLPKDLARGTGSASLSPSGLVTGMPYRVASKLSTTGAGSSGWIEADFSSVSDEYRFARVDSGTDSGVVAWLNTVTVKRRPRSAHERRMK